MSEKMTRTRRNRRELSHIKKDAKRIAHDAGKIGVGNDGKSHRTGRHRSTSSAGPKATSGAPSMHLGAQSVKVKELGPKEKRVTSISHSKQALHVNGTDGSVVVVAESVKNIAAFSQGVAASLSKIAPYIFYHTLNAEEQTEYLTPLDIVAYNFVCILAAYNKVKMLKSDFSAIINGVPGNIPVLLPVAEYIRHRILVVGAPTIARECVYTTDWTVSTGQIVTPAVTNDLSTNQFGSETNLDWFQLWNYSSVQSSGDDYTTSSVSFNPTINLINGPTSWFNTRFGIVADYITGLAELGKVNFDDIVIATVDYSGFAGAESGRTWQNARRCLSPGVRFNVDVAMWLNPNSTNEWFPDGSYQTPVLPPTFAVRGLYGNSFGGGGEWVGQQTVPLNMTRVAQVTGTFNHVTLMSQILPKQIFGKNGYQYCGLPFPQIGRIVNSPIDTVGLTAKLLQIYVAQLNVYADSSSLVIPPGHLNAIAAIAQGVIVRKILSAGQFEHLITLSPNTPTSLWNPQALIPSMEYCTASFPLGWAQILTQIGPTSNEGILFVPSFGTTLPQLWLQGSGIAKYAFWPKFGFNSQTALGAYAQDQYPPLGAGFAPANTDLTQYNHPYVALSNPSGPKADLMYWYNPSAYGIINNQTIFPTGTPTVSTVVDNTSGIVYPSLKVTGVFNYGVTEQNAYNNALVASSGRETNLVYQYAGIDNALLFISQVGGLNVKSARGYNIVPSYRMLGGCGMMAMVLGSVTNTVERTYIQASFAVDNGGGQLVVQQFGVLMSTTESNYMFSSAFFTNPRIWLTATTEICKTYLTDSNRPTELSAYTKLPFCVRLMDKNGFVLMQQYAQALATDGSGINTEIKKYLSKPASMNDVEMAVTPVHVSENQAIGYAEGVLLDTAVNSQFTFGGKATSEEHFQKEMKLSKARGVPTQPVALANAIGRVSTMICADDSAVGKIYSLGKGVWKGIKTVAPYAKDIGEVASLFLL
jgi:hypothetical protein